MRFVALAFALLGVIMNIKADIPDCNYFDTVDLTNSRPLKNGSYIYENIVIPREKTGEYDYELRFDDEIVTVPKHIRGCACQIKSCIRFCCDPDMVLVEGKCEHLHKSEHNSNISITLQNGEEVEIDLMDFEFIIQKHLPVPCDEPNYLDPKDDNRHGWTLYENGSLFRAYDGSILSKQEYCIQRHQGKENYTKLIPYQCFKTTGQHVEYLQAVSVFFIILIIILYQILPNFKSFHGKCCTCYFVCLAITYTEVIIARITYVDSFDIAICKLLGYSGYYFCMATFLWLFIITYNLWKTFQNIGVSRRSRYKRYHIFVWGVAALLLFITFLVDILNNDAEVDDPPEELVWIPGVGLNACWIKTHDWSAMIYYYGPMLVLISCNITLFILTAKRIFVENRKNRRQLKKSESQRNIRNFTNYVVFLRLFAIVGVLWIVEVLAYIIAIYNPETIWETSAEILASGQGIILFMVTILKKDVFKSLLEHLGIANSQPETTRTSTSSQVAVTELELLPKA